MSFGKKRTINLHEYGVEGEIVMSLPTFRRINRMSNEIGEYVEFVNGEATMKGGKVPIGDITVAGVLSFVESAPFIPTLEHFYDFTDIIDEKTGKGQDLFNVMQEYAVEINKGDDSPFVDSQEVEIQSSD